MKTPILQQLKVTNQQVIAPKQLHALKGGKDAEKEHRPETSIIIEDDLGV